VQLRHHAGERSGQGRLAVIDMTNGPDIDVRLGPLEPLFQHVGFLLTREHLLAHY
jgi:hypothetical protein